MAKNSIRDYDATSGNNTDVQSVDISEGCAASGINNALREIMADLKDVSTGTVNLETPAADRLDVDNIRIDGNTISSTDANGNVTIDPAGTGSIVAAQVASSSLDIEGDRTDAQITLKGGSAGAGIQLFGSTYTNYAGAMYLDATASTTGTNDAQMVFRTGSSPSEAMRIDSSGNVGIGTASPSGVLHTAGSGDQTVTLQAGGESKLEMKIDGNSDGCSIRFSDSDAASQGQIRYQHSTDALVIYTNGNNERMRLDSSGNLLVGTTTNGTTADGTVIRASGEVLMTRTNAQPLLLNRAGNDGAHIEIRQANTVRGFIGTNESQVFISGTSRGLRFGHSGSDAQIIPVSASGQAVDDHVDLGAASIRFDDIYATTGTIQTSDQNEKQQIASLTTAEMTAAKAISKLFKTFKWNNSVTEKGDAARTHTGVIAQEVQTAMTDAGLDAADYAFWCSDTWTNDDGTSQTRLGIRYPELLAFVGAATEQRMADIETRLTALENA